MQAHLSVIVSLVGIDMVAVVVVVVVVRWKGEIFWLDPISEQKTAYISMAPHVT